MSYDPSTKNPICPTCGFVMCEQFDEHEERGVTVMVPNGTYICYHCEKDKP